MDRAQCGTPCEPVKWPLPTRGSVNLSDPVHTRPKCQSRTYCYWYTYPNSDHDRHH